MLLYSKCIPASSISCLQRFTY